MRRQKTFFFPANQNIRESKLRVIDPQGQHLGILTREEALKKANAFDLDLVLVSSSAKPPVARIIDLSKFRYEQKKRASHSRKGRKTTLKQLRFKPNIGDYDLEVRIKRAKEFLENGDKVKFIIPFYGRMKRYKSLGYKKLDQVINNLADAGEIESPAHMEGSFLMMVVKPCPK